MSEQITNQGHVTTEHAQRYMIQLCKHFGHKIPVTHDDQQGTITFEVGTAQLTAEGDRLTCTVTGADAAAVARLQDIIDRHLVRFAFREDLSGLTWAAD